MNDKAPVYDIVLPTTKTKPTKTTERLLRVEACAKAYLHEQDHGSSHGAEREARKALVEALKE